MLNHEIINNNKEEWVVFVHGIGGSTKTWKNQIESFSDKYNLLLLDLPGHGQNSNNIIKKINSETLNNDIIETMNHIGIKKAHFVGLSLGTIVIANFAVKNPSYVKSIIFGGSVLAIRGIYRLFVRLANSIKRIVPYEFLYKFFAWFMMPKRNHKKSRSIFLREAVKLDKNTMFAWISYLTNSLHHGNLFNQLDKLGKKILFISGDEDHCFIKGSAFLANRIRSATLKIIDHCGHVCSIEKYSIFNQHAIEYLSR